MSELPIALDAVLIPERFSPSQLSMVADCPLRVVLSTATPSKPRLPSNPGAERGSVFHELLERAGKGLIESSPAPRTAIEMTLNALLDRAEQRLASRPETSHFARLRDAFSSVDWHNACQKIIALALRLLDRAPIPAPTAALGTPAERLDFSRLGDTGTWFEVNISAPLLRLSGRMDVLEKSSEKIVVRDYKTGQAYDREGNVLPHIELQLRLYALAILENQPQAKIELCISEGKDAKITLDGAIISETKTWLETQLASLPAHTTVPASSLARPGPSCLYCPFRHVCPAYLEQAPTLWLSGTLGAAMPLDIWGEVIALTEGESGISLELRDAAGRRVKIQRLSKRHAALVSSIPGAKLFLFGLATSRSAPANGRYCHPRNFFELPADSSQRRAWSLSIFSDQTSHE